MSEYMWAAVSAPLCFAVLFDCYLILDVTLLLLERIKWMN